MSTDEEVVRGSVPLRVTIEFDSEVPLSIAGALFNSLVGRAAKMSGEASVDFSVTYAGELSNILCALEESFDNNYSMTFRWTESRTGLYIIVLSI